MKRRTKEQALSPRLDGVRRRFAEWRRQGGGKGRRIPAELWAAAGEVAKAEGVYRVSQALRLDFSRLKQRAANLSARQGTGPQVSFVQVEASPVCAGGQAVVEVMCRGGERVRMELSGKPQLDVAALVEAVVRGARS